jgi:hypothetical protein
VKSAAIASPKFGDHLARKCATTQQSRNRYVANKFLDTQHSPRSLAHASSEYIGCSRSQAHCTLPNSCRILRNAVTTQTRQTGGGDNVRREGHGVAVMSRSISPELRSALHRLRHLSCQALTAQLFKLDGRAQFRERECMTWCSKNFPNFKLQTLNEHRTTRHTRTRVQGVLPLSSTFQRAR